jgi:hypothetical protein
MADMEKAKQFIELSKTNQENLWKRRSIEWKVNFGLWAALGVIAGFCYEKDLSLDPTQHPYAIWAILGCVFIAYVWNNIGTVISNEKDLDWQIYYKALAEKELTGANADRGRPNPEWYLWHYVFKGGKEEKAKSIREAVKRFLRGKLHTAVAPAIITLAILLALGLIASGAIHKGPESASPEAPASVGPAQPPAGVSAK